MTVFVNLATLHDYSIDKTIEAFVKLGKSHNCQKFFQEHIDKRWIGEKLHANAKLIEDFKLGKLSKNQFFDELSQILHFLNDIDKTARNNLLANTWISSIELSTTTKDRLGMLLGKYNDQPIYLISNTNELDISVILDLFQKNYLDLKWNKNADFSIKESREPIEILPNVYLCVSYRFGVFKENTATKKGLIDYLATQCPGPKTLISQHSGDLDIGRHLEFEHLLTAEEFYTSNGSCLLSKNNNSPALI
jgi:hypothetical protein